MAPIENSLVNEEFTYKILLLGDYAVGKTSIKRSYMGEQFKDQYASTVGADFAYYGETVDNVRYKYNIWDLAGEQKFNKIRKMFYTGALGAIICFDLTRQETLQNLKLWIQELQENTSGIPFTIVANKIDIYDKENSKHVQLKDIDKLIQELHDVHSVKFKISLLKTSAKERKNIDEAFTTLRKLIKEKNPYV